MSVQFVAGNLLDSQMQTLVNTVNCVGIMGKGIALDFRNRYPEMFTDYKRRCERGEVKLGEPYVFPKPQSQLSLELIDEPAKNDGPLIVNFPTKQHWKSRSDLEAVKRGLGKLGESLVEWDITSIAIPPLGCGNGGLDWCDVGPLLREFASGLEIQVELYVPPGVDPSSPFSTCT